MGDFDRFSFFLLQTKDKSQKSRFDRRKRLKKTVEGNYLLKVFFREKNAYGNSKVIV